MILKTLANRGIDDVFAEGGPRVHKSLLESGLADKIAVYIAPVLIGNDDENVTLNLTQPVDTLYDRSIEQMGEDLLIQGYLKPVPAK